jgi:hypothetical protein
MAENPHKLQQEFLNRTRAANKTKDAADHHNLNVRATPTRRADGRIWRAVDTGSRKRSKGVVAVAGTEYGAYLDGSQRVAVQK